MTIVRMFMRDAAALADLLLDVRGTRREDVLCEQLWLRAVLVEQRRRTVLSERESFDAMADRLLAALDPIPTEPFLMPQAKTIVGYLYRGEAYCPACIVDIASPWWRISRPHNDAEAELNAVAGVCGIDRSREHTFSQHDFPHAITDDMLEPPRIMCDACSEEIR